MNTVNSSVMKYIIIKILMLATLLKIARPQQIIAPPPLSLNSRHRRHDEPDTGIDFMKVVKMGKLAGFDKNKFKTKTAAAKKYRKLEDLDVEPFKVKYSSVSLNIQPVDCTFGHNEVRRWHGLPHLVWDIDLSYGAKEWAAILAARDTGIEHSPQDDDDYYYGENIYWSGSNSGVNCNDAIWSWYKEYSDFSYSKPVQTDDNGHFLELVWPETTRLGVGIAFTPQKKSTFIVARYLAGVIGTDLDIVPKPLDENQSYDKESLLPKDSPDPLISELFIPPDGGWTAWVDVSRCSKTCGRDAVYLQVRYCIDTSSTTSNPGKCEGNTTRLKSCGLLVPCPGEGIINIKDGKCEDLKQSECKADVVPNGGRHECRSKPNNKLMSKNCKRTCKFCTPCVNYHKDCARYAAPPYNYCTNDTYSPWMEWKCAKTCRYCNRNQTVLTETDCYDLTYDCIQYATNDQYCRSAKYSKWMKQACKESCGFCRPCENKNVYCKVLKNDYEYCTDDMYSSYMYKLCGETCGYCFDGSIPKDIDSIQDERPPKLTEE